MSSDGVTHPTEPIRDCWVEVGRLVFEDYDPPKIYDGIILVTVSLPKGPGRFTFNDEQ